MGEMADYVLDAYVMENLRDDYVNGVRSQQYSYEDIEDLNYDLSQAVKDLE